MSVNIQDRPIESVREEVIEVLIYNYSHGKIHEDAFERRLDVAMDSLDAEKIMSQIADLELPPTGATKDYDTPEIGIQYSTEQADETENIVCIFGGAKRAGPWLVPKQINTVFVFGGGEIDFNHATFTSKQVTLKVFCLFGGGTVSVPEGVRVSSSTICLFGGVTNKVRTKPDYDGPLLRIEGLVMFGGLDIKIKQTVKEKFVAFANQMKALFDPNVKL